MHAQDFLEFLPVTKSSLYFFFVESWENGGVGRGSPKEEGRQEQEAGDGGQDAPALRGSFR